MKYCYVCKQTLPEECFGKNKSKKDGLSCECKECKKIKDKESHQRNRESRLEKMKQYRQDNLEELREKDREFARSERGRENNRKATKRYYDNHREERIQTIKDWRQNNPLKYQARYKIMNAVKLGNVVIPEKCEMCEREEKLYGHHEDYNKPLEVIWVCRK